MKTSASVKVRSEVGMTLKVIKGSVWGFIGQVLPLFATFIATPFVLRSLGSEAYGVLLLVGLMASYFSFGDLGMGLASTKYSAEAYSKGLPEEEGMVVRTAALISFGASVIIAIPMFVFSEYIMRDLLKVPSGIVREASIGLKITCFSFVINFLANIFNSPQLARMRMELNVMVMTGGKLFMILLTPIILYLGGGIIEACLVSLTASLLMLVSNIVISHRLLPTLIGWSISRGHFRTLFQFGKNIVFYGIGLTLINYIERFILARNISVSALSYYSIAATFALMTTMFSMSMVQSLLPAFSQLLVPEKREQLQNLYSRTMRLSIIFIMPVIAGLIVIARPFFTIWAGPDFGRNSVTPFYIMMIGVFISLVAYIPYSLILASGKSNWYTRLYLIELLPYGLIVYLLIQRFGIVGAGISFALKESINGVFSIVVAGRISGLGFALKSYLKYLFLGAAIFIPSICLAILLEFALWQLFLFLIVSVLYLYIIYWKILTSEERNWGNGHFYTWRQRIKLIK